MRGLFVRLLRLALRLMFGLSIGHRERLPRAGPAIVAANHNSHLDTLVILAAFSPKVLPWVTPVAAADYWSTGFAAAVARRLVGFVPLERRPGRGTDPLAGARDALAAGRILLVFPEGTRGRPEEMGPLKSGLSKLARDAGAPVTPVYLQGAGQILPKGTRVPVPFTVTLLVGEPIAPTEDRAALMAELADAFARLKAEAPPLHWS